MNEKTLRILEYDKIINKLAGFTFTTGTKSQGALP